MFAYVMQSVPVYSGYAMGILLGALIVVALTARRFRK